MKTLRRFAEHPLVNLFVALILVATSLSEGWGTLRADMMSLNLGAHHGVLIYGLVHLLRSLPVLVEAAERGGKAAV